MHVGAIVGRFQVDDLHPGHVALINHALSLHRHVVVFIGVDPMAGTRHDPLDYPTRARMVRSRFPVVETMPIQDMGSDEDWSRQIDGQLVVFCPQLTEATLYGGRDGFVPHYRGIHRAFEIDTGISYQSGTALRRDIGRTFYDSIDFRRGIIHATQNTRQHVLTSVYIAALKGGKLLLVRQQHNPGWTLPGATLSPLERLDAQARRALSLHVDGSIEGPIRFVGGVEAVDMGWPFRHFDAGTFGLLMAGDVTFGPLTPAKGAATLKTALFELPLVDGLNVEPSHRTMIGLL